MKFLALFKVLYVLLVSLSYIHSDEVEVNEENTFEKRQLRLDSSGEGYILCNTNKFEIIPQYIIQCKDCGNVTTFFDCDENNRCSPIKFNQVCIYIYQPFFKLCISINTKNINLQGIICFETQNTEEAKKSDAIDVPKKIQNQKIERINYLNNFDFQKFTTSIESVKEFLYEFVYTMELKQFAYIHTELINTIFNRFISLVQQCGSINTDYFDKYPFDKNSVLVNNFVTRFYVAYYRYKEAKNIYDYMSFFSMISGEYSVNAYSENTQNGYGKSLYELTKDECPSQFNKSITNKNSQILQHEKDYCEYLKDMLAVNSTFSCKHIYIESLKYCKDSTYTSRVLAVYATDQYCNKNNKLNYTFPCHLPQSLEQVIDWMTNARRLLNHINIQFEFPTFFMQRLEQIIQSRYFKEYIDCNYQNSVDIFIKLMGKLFKDSAHSVSLQRNTILFNRTVNIYNLFIKKHGRYIQLDYDIYTQVVYLTTLKKNSITKINLQIIGMFLENIIKNANKQDKHVYQMLCNFCTKKRDELTKFYPNTKCNNCNS